MNEKHFVEIKVILDNNKYKDLETAWGLSIFVKFKDRRILFDTGPDPLILLKNSEKLGINLEAIDLIVLSHDHLDHVGGILLFENSGKEVYVPANFDIKDELSNIGVKVIETKDIRMIDEDVYTFAIDFEEALVINTERGIILFTGCSHPGIENFVRKVVEKFKQKIYLIIGGFHYPSKTQLDFIAKYSEKICPLHCTGEKARNYLKEKYPSKFIEGGVGLELII